MAENHRYVKHRVTVNWYWREQAWGVHPGRTRDGCYRQVVVNLGPLNITAVRSVHAR